MDVQGVILECGACGRYLCQTRGGVAFHVRPEYDSRGREHGPPKGPIYGPAPGRMLDGRYIPSKDGRSRMPYIPAHDGRPHRFECRCGAVWHVPDLPIGKPGTHIRLS